MITGRTAKCGARSAICFLPRYVRSKKFSIRTSRAMKVVSKGNRAETKMRSWPNCKSKSLLPRGSFSATNRDRQKSEADMKNHLKKFVVAVVFSAAVSLAQDRAPGNAPKTGGGYAT